MCTISRHKDFLVQLENFRHEAYVTAQYLYADMAVQHAASKSKKLLSRLNMSPRFWLAHAAASQEAAYIALGRVFDTKSKYNVNALLDAFEANLSLFQISSFFKTLKTILLFLQKHLIHSLLSPLFSSYLFPSLC